MAKVTKLNLVIPQGSTYIHEFEYVREIGDENPPKYIPVKLTGYTARMQIRESEDSTTTLDDGSQFNWTIKEQTGLIILEIPHWITYSWSFEDAVYDIELVSPDLPVPRVFKLCRGTLKVIPAITRPNEIVVDAGMPVEWN